MDRLGQSLLRDCLNHPGDPGQRLVYADWLGEQPWGEGHAALVRETARWAWGYGPLNRRWSLGGLAEVWQVSPWEPGFASGRQRWRWWALGRPDGTSYWGSAATSSGAMRRALRALLTCRRRDCACGRG